MIWALPVVVGLVLGVVLGFVMSRRRQKDEQRLGLAGLTRRFEEELVKERRALDSRLADARQKENDETRKLDQRLDKDRRHLEERRNSLISREQKVSARERDVASLNEDVREWRRSTRQQQKKLKQNRREIDSIRDQQKEQLFDKLETDFETVRSQWLETLENEVELERQAWSRRLIEEAEHEDQLRAEDLVDTLVCRMQLKPTVRPQETKLSIPNKKNIQEALKEGSPVIEAIEKLTKVELLFDEERQEVKVSAYDGVARENCRRLLERFFQEWKGNIDWIEKTLPQIVRRVEREMTRTCGDLMRRLKVDKKMPVEVVRMQGRLKYRTSYGQNVLDHVLEAGFLGGMMSEELGLDLQVGRRSSFLHDVGKAIDVTQEGTHPDLGGRFLVTHGEFPIVSHAAAMHHGPFMNSMLYTAIAKSADAMSGGRPGARRETIDNYVERVESLETIAKQQGKGISGVSVIQGGREVLVNVDTEKVTDDELQKIADRIAATIEEELTYPGEIEVNVVRETWARETAH